MPSTDSAPVTGTIVLEGVWIHDPLDAQGTVHQYLYGRSARSGDLDVMSQGSFFAGRADPVVDFGEHVSESVRVAVEIPNGAAWAAQLEELSTFARAKRPLVFRDNRGRQMAATMSGYAESDMDWGTAVSFTMTRVSYEIPVAG